MPPKRLKISLVYFVICTLLLVGLVPLVLVGWFLSGRSATELRAVENRYQIQLVQEKARRIEMFGQKYRDMVTGLADAFALSSDPLIFSSPRTDQQLSTTLRENADLIAIYVKPEGAESLSLYRPGNITRTDVDGAASSVLETLAPEGVTVGEPRMVGHGEPF